jgi:hypothetical protein
MNEQEQYPDALRINKEAQTVDEARTRIDTERAVRPPDAALQFPTWRYAKDGRTAVVESPQALEELEADGGDWRDAPHKADTEYVPGGVRTFAGPVGAVDARGAAARYDRPTSEVALTTALPKNEAGSVPSDQAELRQRQAQSPDKATSSPTEAIMARMQARIDELERENGDLKVKARKAANTDDKGQDKRTSTADSRAEAREEAEISEEIKARRDAERQSEAAEGAKPTGKKKTAAKKK